MSSPSSSSHFRPQPRLTAGRFAILPLLFGLLFSTQLPLQADAPATLRPIAAGLGGYSYWSHGPFANTFLSASEYLEYTTDWGTAVYLQNEDGTPNPQFNARGLPRYLNPGRKLRVLMWPFSVHASGEPADWPKRGMTGYGKWVVTWVGDADIRLQGATFVAAESSGPATGRLVNGRRVYQMGASNPSGHITFEDINPSVGVNDLKVWLPDPANPTGQSLENSGQFWHPAFLANIAAMEFGSIRFMDWGNTNQSPQRDWIDRRLPDNVMQGGVINRRSPAPGSVAWTDSSGQPVYFEGNRTTGIAWEYMVQLSNLTGRDMWICIPHMATDDYVTKLARLIRYGSDGVNPYTSPQANPVYPPLNPDLKIWVEYSNEIWSNGYSFPQGNWAEAQAIAAGLGGGNEGKAKFNARRASQIWSTFQQVFGGSERIVRVGAIWTGQDSYTTPFLTELRDYGPTLNPAVQPDVISPTTYFGNGIQDWAYEQANLNRYNPQNSWFHTEEDFVHNTSTGETRPVSKPLSDPYWTSTKLQQDLSSTFDEWKRRIFSGSTIGGGGFDTTGVQGGFNASLATLVFNTFGRHLPLVSYEGGPSLYTDYYDSGDVRDDGVTNFMNVLNRRPEFEEIYRIQLNMARAKGLATHGLFVDVSAYGKYGQWGHLEYLDQPHEQAPKWQAVKHWGDDMMRIRNPLFPQGAVPSFVTNGTLPEAAYLQPYSTDIVATGGDVASGSALEWQVVGSLLAPGLTIAPVPGDTNRYRLEGTPQRGGWSYVYLRVNDDDGDAAWKVFSLYVPGGPGTLVESNVKGATSAASLPYTTAQAFDSERITWSGIVRGAPGQSGGGSALGTDGTGVNIFSDTNRLRFSVDQGNVFESASTLASAITDNEYFGFTITPNSGQVLDLRNAEFQLTWERIEYHAPRYLAVFTSVDGFTAGQQVYTSPRTTSTGEPITIRFRLPSTAAYNNLTSPVQFRIYFYGSNYAHKASFQGIKLTRDVDTSIPVEPLPPVFAANPFNRPNAVVGSLYVSTLAGSATDPNLDPITWTKLSGPDWLTIAPDGSLSGTPSAAHSGLNTFSVRASDPGGLHANATFTLQVVDPPPATPVFTPVGASFNGPITIALSTATPGTSIRYTTDGSTPSASSGNIYSAPFLLSNSATVRAVAYKAGSAESAIASATYTISAGGGATGAYQALSSTQAGGPIFAWRDTSTASGGTQIWGSSDVDDGVVTLNFPAGFNFPFYGTSYSSVNICSNGFLSFGDTANQFSARALPNASAPHSLIAAFWTDLYLLRNSSSVTWRLLDADTLAITFSQARLYSARTNSSVFVTFQVVLHRDGRILLNYSGNTTGITNYTVGIQNQTRTDGLQVSYNSNLIPTGSSIQFAILIQQQVPKAAAPTVLTAPGTYQPPLPIELVSATPGASIRYTLDGTEPTASSGTLYSGAFSLTHSAELRAIAYAPGLSDSAVSRFTFTLQSQSSVAFADADSSVSENGGQIVLAVKRLNGISGPLSVDYATQDGSALAGLDYTATSGTLTWADGDASDKTITIQILDDSVFYENEEYFYVTLSNPLNGTLGSPATALVRIQDDDTNAPPVLTRILPASGTPQIRAHESLLLSYQVSDDGALPPGLLWEKVSGNGQAHFSDPGSPITYVMFDTPGAYLVRLTAQDGVNTVHENLTVTVLEATGFSAWIAAHPAFSELAPPQREPGADPFGTGIPNLLAYALDLDPKNPAQTGLPTIGFNPAGGRATLTFNRARPELNYVVEASSNLSEWTVIATNPGTPGTQVTVEDVVALSPAVPARHLRLRVSE